jgi:hypothetical protein
VHTSKGDLASRSPFPLGQPHVHVALELLSTDELLDEKEFGFRGHLGLGAVGTGTRVVLVPKGLAACALYKRVSTHATVARGDSLWVLTDGASVSASARQGARGQRLTGMSGI